VTFKHAARKFVQSWGLNVSRFPSDDHPTLQVVKLLQHCNINLVLDVGANEGQYATGLRRFGYANRIVSFEPVGEPYRSLEKHCRFDSDWMSMNCAIGAKSATTTIHVAANNSASSSMLPMLPAHEDAAPTAKIIGVETVTQHTLDSLWPQITRQTDVVFLKADVQGYERHVLNGVVNNLDRITGMQLELSMVPLYEGAWLYDEALKWSCEQGFTLMSVIPGFTDVRTGQMLQCDGVFFRT
jgi:FkbM family methyltransferase